MTLLAMCLKKLSSAYYSDYDRLIAIKSVFYSSSITETTDTCLDRLFQICLYSNENIVELCRDQYFIARLIRIVQEPLMSEDVGVIGAKSKALVLTRLFLQMRHSLSNEVKKEFALNSDAILNCLSISKKAIENDEERNYQVIQFYRIVIQILDMLTVNKELQQLTLFHDETIGKTWAKAVVICTEMSLELYRQHYLSRRSFLQLSTNSVSFLLRCCFIPELLPVLCAEDGLVEMLFNLMVTLQFDNPICKEICRVFTKMFTVMEAPTGFWNAYKEFFDGRDSSGNYL